LLGRRLGIAGFGIADGVFIETVAVFALPAKTDVIVLLLTVWPLAIVVITDDAPLKVFIGILETALTV
jgi:hypothetical protein